MEVLAHTKHTKRLSLVTTAVSVLITFLLLMTHQYISGYQQLDEELGTQAAIIATNSAAALAFNDRKAAHENLGAVRKTPRILGAALYDSDGKLFASLDETPAVFPDAIDTESLAPPSPRTAPGPFAHLMREEVMQDGNRVGSLVLLATHRPLYVNLLAYAVGLVLIGAISLFLARRFTASLRKKMALTEGQLEQMALYDRVTGLPNRRFFEYELKKAITRITREGKTAALLMIDVDDFKKVNDLCGHQTGDDVLMMIGSRLKRLVRGDDLLARVGGDEFAAILFMVGDPENANRLCERMIEEIAKPFPTQPIPSHVGLSIGVTLMPADSDDPATLLRWADMAMYEAKAHGKNRAQFFSEKISRKVRANLQIEAGLRQALASPDGGLHVALQPQVCARTRRIVGAEALARWNQRDGTPAPPGEFIPVAEKSGLIIELGGWLVDRVCQDLAELRRAGVELGKVAINVSPRELTRGNAIVEKACRTVRRYGEDIGKFQFEITENALMAENAGEVLDAFTHSGFSLAIDDFGTGYSSLGYLKRFQISTLKIDKSFIQKLPVDKDDATIVAAVIQMAKALEISVVAEGVETEEQAAFLTSLGCDILQGFLISRPLPPKEFIAFVEAYSTATFENV